MYENAYRDKLATKKPDITSIAKKLDEAIEQGGKSNKAYIVVNNQILTAEELQGTGYYDQMGASLLKYIKPFMVGVDFKTGKLYSNKHFNNVSYASYSGSVGVARRIVIGRGYLDDFVVGCGIRAGRCYYKDLMIKDANAKEDMHNFIAGYATIAVTLKFFESLKLRVFFEIEFDPKLSDLDSTTSRFKKQMGIGIEL